MPELLRCPTCSAPLDAPALHDTTARCPYCRASVRLGDRAGASGGAPPQSAAVEEVLRQLRAGNRIAAIKVYRDHFGGGLKEAKEAVERLEATLPPGTVPKRSAAGGLVGCVVLLLVVAGVVVLLTRRGSPPPAADPPRTVAGSTPTATPAEPPAPPAFADVVLRFGSEGTGAGRFEDARSVGVDGAGRIYVAEYSGGRVQVFDSLGTFVTQWMAEPKMPLVDMEVDRGGTVYVVQGGRIRRYEGATGRPLGTVDGAGQGVNDLALALDGTLWTASGSADVVHLSRGGAVLRRVDLQRSADDAAPARLVVSGEGEVYALDRWTYEIYRLDAAGKFVDRFGGKGDGPEQFHWATDLAIDGRGRVYVSDVMRGIRVFDATGHFVDAFAGREVVFGMAFDDHDGLYTAQRNNHQIVKVRLQQ
ncbi:MAG TPA: 6-bladed beta-propeller [Longimicrobium sp.]|nr:6-bladed beta-propeller [Longimicrobium sp.]